LINSTKQSLHLDHMTKDHCDRALVSQLRQVHLDHYGPGYDAFFKVEPLLIQQVASGCGEITIGSLDGGGPVSASVFIDQNGTTTYWAGRYRRTERGCFSHYPLYEAIRRSRDRGMARFYLGYLGGWEKRSPKLASIAFFKSGFANHSYSEPVWCLTRNRQPPS
jgi:hypothetical protein